MTINLEISEIDHGLKMEVYTSKFFGACGEPRYKRIYNDANRQSLDMFKNHVGI